MKNAVRSNWMLPVVSLVLLCGAAQELNGAGPRPGPPNVLLILADDLGFSDLGCYGGEIQTPHLDWLAAQGLRFTQCYNTTRCWPTRAALLTGYYAQQVRRDTLEGIPSGIGGRRPPWALLLSRRLQSAGYRCYHSGKWHVDGRPLKQGFDCSYLLSDQGRFFYPKLHWEDDRRLPPVQANSGYYATTAIADHAIRCLQHHARLHADRPFFHYLAFTAPHFPLQALPADITRYDTRYQRGWEVIRQARWERLQHLGIVQGRLPDVEPELGPPHHCQDAIGIFGPGEVGRAVPWQSLTAEQQTFQAAKMAIHAAMVDRMDREIGRVLEQLRAMDALEQTLILFLSDNGASSEIMGHVDCHDGRAAPGSAGTHLCLGPGWSAAANTPFRRHKTWVHEGGIATPLIVCWRAGLAARGELRHSVAHVIDVVPTLLDLAELPCGPTAAAAANLGYTIPAFPGHSLRPVWLADQPREGALWWQHEGNRAMRVGCWKLVAAGHDAPWELYDLSQDRTETTDLAAQYPDQVSQLSLAWQQQFETFQQDATLDWPWRAR